MKLYTAPTSPFGRKASIVAREHGIELDEEFCNPFESEELARLNPLKLIPVLVLDDGAVVPESQLICEYLDSIGTGPTLESQADALIPGAMRMDKICAVIGLGHMEFRHGEVWRDDAPNLAAWYDDAMERPSFAKTAMD